MRKIKAVHIVAMEAPPLGVPPEFRYLVPSYVMHIASPFLVYNTIAVLIQMPAAERRAGEVSKSIQAAQETEGAWAPARALADEARAQLDARGVAATVAPEVRPIPGVEDRRYTLSMENWLAPIRAWYKDAKPAAGYAGFRSGRPLYILELAVANYEIVENKLLMSVMMKMIDPFDGRVMGRAYAYVDPARMPKVGPLDQAFGGDAKPFKEIVTAEGRILVEECLAQLRFLE
ncbi:MAG TPA: hypothetical protein VIJ43_08940 [Burkholderiales bacterium]